MMRQSSRLWWRRPNPAEEVAPDELTRGEQHCQLGQLIEQHRYT